MANYYDGFLGQTMKNGTQGCVEGVGLMGAGTSPFLRDEYNNGVVNVDRLVNDAANKGVGIIDYDPSRVRSGDTIVYGNNDHVVLSDGAGGYYGNSSSLNRLVHGTDANEMGGLAPTKIIQTGNDGGFTYSAKDASGNPFLQMQANIRTSNPNEPFDAQRIAQLLTNTRGIQRARQNYHDYLQAPNYNIQLLGLGSKKRGLLSDFANQLMNRRDQSIKEQQSIEDQNDKISRAVQIAQMINGSNSIDNRRGYASLAALAGINLPDGADQFVSGPKLLENMQTQINNERNYNLKQKQIDQQRELKEQELAMKGKLIDAQIAAAMRKASGGGGGSSKEQHYSIGDVAKIKDALSAPFQQVLQAASDGSMSGDEIKEALKNAEYENINTLALLEPSGAGPARAYGQEVEDNTINKLKDWYGDDMSDQDHTWTNNWISRALGWTQHDD